jgi:hypothetical protein
MYDVQNLVLNVLAISFFQGKLGEFWMMTLDGHLLRLLVASTPREQFLILQALIITHEL